MYKKKSKPLSISSGHKRKFQDEEFHDIDERPGRPQGPLAPPPPPPPPQNMPRRPPPQGRNDAPLSNSE